MAEKVAHIPQRKTFGKGQTIFKEGEPGSEAYILESGQVRIFKMVAGKRVPIGRVKQWGVFGEMALLDDGPRMAAAMAEEDSVCIVLKKEIVQHMMDEAPKGLTTLLHSMVQTMRTMGDDLAEARARLIEHDAAK
jgi:CRP-like cAMP-binding protein